MGRSPTGAGPIPHQFSSDAPTVSVRMPTDYWRPNGVRTGIDKTPDDYRENNGENQVVMHGSVCACEEWLHVGILPNRGRDLDRLIVTDIDPAPGSYAKLSGWTS